MCYLRVVDTQTSKYRPNFSSRTLLYNTDNNPMEARCSKFHHKGAVSRLQLHQGSSHGSGDQRLHLFSPADTPVLWPKAIPR